MYANIIKAMDEILSVWNPGCILLWSMSQFRLRLQLLTSAALESAPGWQDSGTDLRDPSAKEHLAYDSFQSEWMNKQGSRLVGRVSHRVAEPAQRFLSGPCHIPEPRPGVALLGGCQGWPSAVCSQSGCGHRIQSDTPLPAAGEMDWLQPGSQLWGWPELVSAAGFSSPRGWWQSRWYPHLPGCAWLSNIIPAPLCSPYSWCVIPSTCPFGLSLMQQCQSPFPRAVCGAVVETDALSVQKESQCHLLSRLMVIRRVSWSENRLFHPTGWQSVRVDCVSPVCLSTKSCSLQAGVHAWPRGDMCLAQTVFTEED